jgi:signal recognition particle receptor subunit beta
MAFTNLDSKEINCKIIYFGPEGAGKTENLRAIYKQTSPDGSGGMLEFEDATGPTKFFDFLPVSLGHYREFHIKLHLFTLPANTLYESVRSLILKGVDGFVFVADARLECMAQNVSSLDETQRLLLNEGYQIGDLAAVIQYNKTDLPDLIPTEILRRDLNPTGLPDHEAVAKNMIGTLETLNLLGQQVLKKIGAMVA